MENAVAVALECGAILMLLLGALAAFGYGGARGEGAESRGFARFEFIADGAGLGACGNGHGLR